MGITNLGHFLFLKKKKKTRSELRIDLSQCSQKQKCSEQVNSVNLYPPPGGSGYFKVYFKFHFVH